MNSKIRHHFVYIDPVHLDELRSRCRNGDPTVHQRTSQLSAAAEAALARKTSSVLDKTDVAASGDRQDFFAIGAYSWPNPATKDGMPYVRRDSEVNPEAYSSDRFDKGRFQTMVEDVKNLALTSYLFDSDEHAEKAVDLLRSWFVTPSTRMNPNLNHAAAQPGVNSGRYSGIIEGVILIEMLDYVALLGDSAAWSDALESGLRAWFRLFSDWLVDSDFGRREIRSDNNHGSYYLAQVMSFSLFGGHTERARSAIPLARIQMAKQFARDGSMPRETDRPNSFFYSLYGLRAFVVLAKLADVFDANLWMHRVNGQQSPAIARSFHFLSPYLTGSATWPGPRKDTGYSSYALQACAIAWPAYPENLLHQMIQFLSAQRDGPQAASDLVINIPRAPESSSGIISLSVPEDDLKPESRKYLREIGSRASKVLSRLGLHIGPKLD